MARPQHVRRDGLTEHDAVPLDDTAALGATRWHLHNLELLARDAQVAPHAAQQRTVPVDIRYVLAARRSMQVVHVLSNYALQYAHAFQVNQGVVARVGLRLLDGLPEVGPVWRLRVILPVQGYMLIKLVMA